MNLKANNIGVDSGTIFIADMDFYKKQGIQKDWDKTLGEGFDVEKGKYTVIWTMPDTWNGKVTGIGIVNITSGKLVISDPCYIIKGDRWDSLLDETKYFENPIDGVVILDKHGGDGCFLVEVKLTKITNDEKQIGVV